MHDRHARAATMHLVLIAALALSTTSADAMIDCRSKPDRAEGRGWRYRVIEGRNCWYRGDARPRTGLQWAEPESSAPKARKRPHSVPTPAPSPELAPAPPPPPLEIVEQTIPVTIAERWPAEPLMPLVVKTVPIRVEPPPSRTLRTIVAFVAGALAFLLIFAALTVPAPLSLWRRLTTKKESV